MQKKKSFFYCLLIGFLFSLYTCSNLMVEATSDPFIPRPALPSDLKKVEESTNSDDESSAGQNEQKASSNTVEEGLFETDIVVYPLNEFEDQESLENFADYVKNDSSLNDQIILEDVSEESRFLLSANYRDSAKEDGQLIVLYFPVNISDQSQAQEVLDKHLLYYPDLFEKGELTSQGDGYDLAFALKVNANADGFGIDTAKQEIEYYDQREPYQYELESNGDDPYRQAIEERFPGEFSFESVEENGKTLVTLRQLPLSERQASVESDDNGSNMAGNLFSQFNTKVDDYLTQINLKEKLMNLGISEDNVSIVTIGVAVVLFLLGIVLIVLGFRR
ncbi:hypothetical protein [Facklamia sp. P9177]|uniref:hypothetical protein n=1 Tax=Facklamia sp. P9177 TaxID=3421945 RepID=UPI003D169D4B